MYFNKDNISEKTLDGKIKVSVCVGDYGFAADSISLIRSVVEGECDFDNVKNYGRILAIDDKFEYLFLVKCLDGKKRRFKYFYNCNGNSLHGDSFRLSNVVYYLSDGTLTQDIEVGDEGFFGYDLGSLRSAVETGDNERCCYGKLTNIHNDVKKFEYNNIFSFTLFYPVKRNYKMEYRPYNWDEVVSFRGRWAKYKNKDEIFELIRFAKLDDVVTVNEMDIKAFLDSCVWLDNSPCGVKIK